MLSHLPRPPTPRAFTLPAQPPTPTPGSKSALAPSGTLHPASFSRTRAAGRTARSDDLVGPGTRGVARPRAHTGYGTPRAYASQFSSPRTPGWELWVTGSERRRHLSLSKSTRAAPRVQLRRGRPRRHVPMCARGRSAPPLRSYRGESQETWAGCPVAPDRRRRADHDRAAPLLSSPAAVISPPSAAAQGGRARVRAYGRWARWLAAPGPISHRDRRIRTHAREQLWEFRVSQKARRATNRAPGRERSLDASRRV